MPRLATWVWAVTALGVLAPPSAAQSWRTVTMSRQASGEPSLRVEVEYGAGTFTVRRAEPGLLYRMRLRYDEEAFEPRAELSGTRLRLGVAGTGRSARVRGGRDGGEMELTLDAESPWTWNSSSELYEPISILAGSPSPTSI